MNRISELTRSGLASPGSRLTVGRPKIAPIASSHSRHDRIEVLVDDFGDVGASLQALGLVAVDRAEQALKQLVRFFRDEAESQSSSSGVPSDRVIGRDTSDGESCWGCNRHAVGMISLGCSCRSRFENISVGAELLIHI